MDMEGFRAIQVRLQKRIVAKVDQLMALVDQLEVQLAEARGKAAALLDAAVGELSAAA